MHYILTSGKAQLAVELSVAAFSAGCIVKMCFGASLPLLSVSATNEIERHREEREEEGGFRH